MSDPHSLQVFIILYSSSLVSILLEKAKSAFKLTVSKQFRKLIKYTQHI